jgi:thiol:disulfide interchange protein
MAKALKKAKYWARRLREIFGLTCGAVATFLTGLTIILVVVVFSLVGALIILSVKLLCLPLVVLASLVYPDDRNYSLPERVVEDVREWWRLMHAEV